MPKGKSGDRRTGAGGKASPRNTASSLSISSPAAVGLLTDKAGQASNIPEITPDILKSMENAFVFMPLMRADGTRLSEDEQDDRRHKALTEAAKRWDALRGADTDEEYERLKEDLYREHLKSFNATKDIRKLSSGRNHLSDEVWIKNHMNQLSAEAVFIELRKQNVPGEQDLYEERLERAEEAFQLKDKQHHIEEKNLVDVKRRTLEQYPNISNRELDGHPPVVQAIKKEAEASEDRDEALIDRDLVRRGGDPYIAVNTVESGSIIKPTDTEGIYTIDFSSGYKTESQPDPPEMYSNGILIHYKPENETELPYLISGDYAGRMIGARKENPHYTNNELAEDLKDQLDGTPGRFSVDSESGSLFFSAEDRRTAEAAARTISEMPDTVFDGEVNYLPEGGVFTEASSDQPNQPDKGELPDSNHYATGAQGLTRKESASRAAKRLTEGGMLTRYGVEFGSDGARQTHVAVNIAVYEGASRNEVYTTATRAARDSGGNLDAVKDALIDLGRFYRGN